MSSSPCPHVCRSQRSSCQPRLLTCQTNIYTHTFAVLLIIYLSLFPLCVHNILAFLLSCYFVLLCFSALDWSSAFDLLNCQCGPSSFFNITVTHICIHSPVNSTVDTLVSICLHPDLLVVLHICHTLFCGIQRCPAAWCSRQRDGWILSFRSPADLDRHTTITLLDSNQSIIIPNA